MVGYMNLVFSEYFVNIVIYILVLFEKFKYIIRDRFKCFIELLFLLGILFDVLIYNVIFL